MAAAPRAQAEDYFQAHEWRALTAKSSWRGLWLVAHAWAVIGLAMAMGWKWPTMIPVAVVIIGARQLGLQILMHDAAHGLLHPNRRVNDFVGFWLCSSALRDYRPYHLQHHRYVQQREDPDLVLSAPFPITRASLLRKARRDLSGQTFFKQRIAPLVQKLRSSMGVRSSKQGAGDSNRLGASGWGFLVLNGVGLAVFLAAGLGWVWLFMWLLPLATWLPLISRIRNIAEHALVAVDEPNPLRQARTTHSGWLERAVLAPYWVNYHSEHHLFTQLPCWSLPLAHQLLRHRGITAQMEVQPSYAAMLRLAAPG